MINVQPWIPPERNQSCLVARHRRAVKYIAPAESRLRRRPKATWMALYVRPGRLVWRSPRAWPGVPVLTPARGRSPPRLRSIRSAGSPAGRRPISLSDCEVLQTRRQLHMGFFRPTPGYGTDIDSGRKEEKTLVPPIGQYQAPGRWTARIEVAGDSAHV